MGQILVHPLGKRKMAIDSDILNMLRYDLDARETQLRRIVADRLAAKPAPRIDDAIVGTYFLVLRSRTLQEAAAEIIYHATSGSRQPPPGSLLAQCTGTCVGIDAFDANERTGLLHLAFPLKMLCQPDGRVTSVDLLHTLANAVLFDVYEHVDVRLVDLQLPDSVISGFPGPAYGPQGLRHRCNFQPDEPAFGTILKPTAGITPEQVGSLVTQAAACSMFLFVKEDENLYPNLDYSPVVERTKCAVAGIENAKSIRGSKGIMFAPHITGAPNEIIETVRAVVEAGASAVMFSETFAGGTVRAVREATMGMEDPPAIYGHNAGIGIKTRGIWREFVDLMARLDGIDFRQTAPLNAGVPFLRPFGDEWLASEAMLSRPLPGIKPTMIVRAGGLDQGNIGLNLADVEKQGTAANVLFLSGSAINSIKNDDSQADPALGAEAMIQAIEVHRSGELADIPIEEYVAALATLADRKKLKSLRTALSQRYPQTSLT